MALVPVYGPVKTVTDCFRFRRKVGTEMALEALTEHVGRSGGVVTELFASAEINGPLCQVAHPALSGKSAMSGQSCTQIKEESAS